MAKARRISRPDHPPPLEPNISKFQPVVYLRRDATGSLFVVDGIEVDGTLHDVDADDGSDIAIYRLEAVAIYHENPSLEVQRSIKYVK